MRWNWLTLTVPCFSDNHRLLTKTLLLFNFSNKHLPTVLRFVEANYKYINSLWGVWVIRLVHIKTKLSIAGTRLWVTLNDACHDNEINLVQYLSLATWCWPSNEYMCQVNWQQVRCIWEILITYNIFVGWYYLDDGFWQYCIGIPQCYDNACGRPLKLWEYLQSKIWPCNILTMMFNNIYAKSKSIRTKRACTVIFFSYKSSAKY